MKRNIWIVLAIAVMLGGCSWMDGSYHSVHPYQKQDAEAVAGDYTASTYLQLRNILAQMVDTGAKNAIIDVSGYNQSVLQGSVDMAIRYASEVYPLGAYAVDEIHYEMGTGAGKPVMAVEISYHHSRAEIDRIQQVESMEASKECVFEALETCQSSVIFQVKGYEHTDFQQLIEDYAELHPDVVMEIPQTFVGVYPDGGSSRIIELKFSYQTSREVLRQMQEQVRPVFSAAKLYVSGDGAQDQKFSQLYAFLMERFEYHVGTSITPTYSLLRHGVGDSKAFATVYAEMCRRAGLECLVIPGTWEGSPWFWNMIKVDESYYHVDLLNCNDQGYFRKLGDADMAGYVWDYTSYPKCATPMPAARPEPTEPEPSVTETVPDQDDLVTNPVS